MILPGFKSLNFHDCPAVIVEIFLYFLDKAIVGRDD